MDTLQEELLDLPYKEQLELLSELIKVGSWELDIISHTQKWSDGVFELLGEEPQKISPSLENFMAYVPAEDQIRIREAIENTLQTHNPYDIFHQVIRKDGSHRYVHARAKLIINNEGDPLRLFGTVLDITEQKVLQKKVQNTLHTLNSVIDNVENLIFYKDTHYRYMGCNHAFEEFYGHTREELIGYDDFRFLPKELAKHFRELDTLVVEKKQKIVNPQWVDYPDGRKVFLHTTTTPFYDKKGNLIGLVGNAVDITKERLLSDLLERQANYDDLTSIPNRNLFITKLKENIQKAQNSQSKFALFFMDLDKFKEINDTYGHAFGDEVLRVVSQKLQRAMRKSDILARLGGDEFAAIMSNVQNKEDVIKLAKKLVHIIDTPIVFEKQRLEVTLSVGIALYPEHGTNGDTLLSVADHAMYLAKEQGKNCYIVA